MKSRAQRAVYRQLMRARRSALPSRNSAPLTYRSHSPLTTREFIIRKTAKAASSRRPSLPPLPWDNVNE